MGYSSVADIIGLSSFVKLWLPPKSRNHAKFEITAVQGHPRSSILVSNRKPMYDFLLVINSNFGRMCYRFRDIDA